MESEVISEVAFYVNRQRVTCLEPDVSLLHYLRRSLFLTGTKESCGEGACGSCTVMVSSYDQRLKRVVHRSQSACLTPVVTVHGKEVTTVEGLVQGNTDTGLHPVQERLAETHGTQCGFCSPGFVMSMYSLLQNQPEPSRQQMERALGGNICRCTGYRPILEGMATLCTQSEETGTSNPPDIEDVGRRHCAGKYDSTQDQAALKSLSARIEDMNVCKQPSKFSGPRSTWYRPTSLADLVNLRTDMPDARLVAGASTLGFIPKRPSGNIYIMTGDIPELHELEIRSEDPVMKYLHVGAAVTFTELKEFLEENAKNETEGTAMHTLHDVVAQFDSPSVANVATVGGNVAGASPTSDINVFMLAVGGEVGTMSHEAVRVTAVNQGYFPSSGMTGLNPQEILTHLRIPLYNHKAFTKSYREDKGSVPMKAVFTVTFEDNCNVVHDAKLAFGGIGPTPLLANSAEKYMLGKRWTGELCTKVSSLLYDELVLPKCSPGGAEEYRNCLVTSLFFRFFTRVKLYLKSCGMDVSEINQSVLPIEYADTPREGVQVFEDPTPENPHDVVGCPIHHSSCQGHVSGHAVYVDDMPPFQNELNLVLLLSPKPRAKIVSLDTSGARKMPGVKAVISARDIGDTNNVRGPDQPAVFATEEVLFEGQPIAAVIAETREQAKCALQAVNVEFEDLKPTMTLKDAIAMGSFLGEQLVFPPNGTDPLVDAPHVLEGEFQMSCQRHIYMETQQAIAVPKGEKGEMDLYISTQAPAFTQQLVARALGVDQNKLAVKVKNVGGAFGAKLFDQLVIGLPVALAGKQLGQPIRGVLDRQEDMLAIGGRNPVIAKYRVAYSDDGKISGVDLSFYFDAGICQLLPPILLEAMTMATNAYNIPRGRLTVRFCRTNSHPGTAFRAVVVPVAMFVTEHCIHRVAEALSLPQKQVHEVNLLRQGDAPFSGEQIREPTVQQCFHTVLSKSNYQALKEKVISFNMQSRWRKRGVSVVPVAYAICGGMVNAMALVHIYKDGSVLVGYSGVEMGQGLHTKMLQIVTRVLGVPLHKVHIKETNTDVAIEGAATGGSFGTQICGMAVISSCEKLAMRLEPFRNTSQSWEELVKCAYDNQVELSETGHYCSPVEKPTFPGGYSHNHVTYGAACSLVEVDCLTGNTEVLSTDIVMDVGKSINPMIDIGQIEGAFLQGYGLFMKEEERFRLDGKLSTTGLASYKVPRIKDIPQKFNVHLLKGRETPNVVYSSKGIGEPPLFLASSVYFATKMAVAAARKDAGLDGKFTLNTPATPERVRLACGDQFTHMSK